MAAIDYGAGPNTSTGDLMPAALGKLRDRLAARGFAPGTLGADIASALAQIENALQLAEAAYQPGTELLLTITGSPPAANVGVPYSFTPTVAYASGPVTFTLTGSLPAGLTFDTATGAVSGMPTAAASAMFTIGAVDSKSSAQVTVALTVTAGGVVTPGTLTATPATASIAANAAAGTLISNIGSVPAGVTPTVTPNDGRFVIAGDATAGWKVVTGMSALSAGSVSLTVAATGANPATVEVTITAASAFLGYHVIPLMGQSNVIGRNGPIDATLDATDPNIMQFGFNSQTVSIAQHPLDHRDETANTVGFGISLAKKYIADGRLPAGYKVLLVPGGQGNTGFSGGSTPGFWRAGGSGDTGAIATVNAAMALPGDNKIVMIAWHQGEADRNQSKAGYSADLDPLIPRWRSSMTGATNAPFIVGALLVGGTQTSVNIQAALSELPTRVPYTAFVSSDGLTDGGDLIHFDAASQRTFGVRYANALPVALANVPGTPAPVTAPGQVTGLVATPGDGQVTLSWTAPSNGGSAITDYIVEDKLSSGSTFTVFADGTGTGTTAVVTGLTNASAYDFRVSAVNAVGTGTPSAVVSATPNVAATPTGTLNDTMTAADNTAMSGRTTDSNHTVTQTIGNSTIIGNMMAGTTVPSEGTYNYTPASIFQTIRSRHKVNTKIGNSFIRYRTVSTNDYYYYGLAGGNHTLAAFAAGATNTYAGAATATPTVNVGDTVDFRLVITGTVGAEIHTLYASINGAAEVQVLSGTPNATAHTRLAGVGLIGWRQSSATSTATTGILIDNISATAA